MYSLVSSAVLAADLARHPHGAAVADAVDRVLALTPDELARMTRPASAGARARVLQACQGHRAGARTTATADRGRLQTSSSRVLVEELAGLLGTVEELLALLHREAPLAGRPDDQVQVALDGVTVAWAGGTAPLDARVELDQPWQQALDPVPPALPLMPWSEQLTALLEEIGRRTPEQWTLSAAAHRQYRGTLTWSRAMHQACRAATDADRLTEVARAQLAAARMLRLAGVSTGPQARAAAMVTTAAVQGICTADLLDPTALRRAWDAGS